jgi:hypothetical protein
VLVDDRGDQRRQFARCLSRVLGTGVIANDDRDMGGRHVSPPERRGSRSGDGYPPSNAGAV